MNNYAKAMAIEKKNKETLLKLNPRLNERSGIYFLTRVDENGFRYAYVGQAKNILQRLASHMAGYKQHIDLSLKKHKLWSQENPNGWVVNFENFSPNRLDEMEKYYIKKYADDGYQLRNVSIGGQGADRASGQVGERKPPKGYRDGIKQGRKMMARELSNIIEKHLIVAVKPDKLANKVSAKQYEKFMDLLKEGETK